MPVTDITKDIDARTLTITAEFAAPVERVWALYADPRQLEQVWGPPEYPATFVDHDLRPGGRMTYYMTSPEGEKFAGYWDIQEVDEPGGFTFRDGFADDDFQPNPELPVSQQRVHLQRDRTVAPGPCSPARYDSADATCRRCSTWASRRAPPAPSTRSTGSWRTTPRTPEPQYSTRSTVSGRTPGPWTRVRPTELMLQGGASVPDQAGST